MAFQDWVENAPSFVTTYDVSLGIAEWQRFYARYTAGRGNSRQLVRVIEIAIQHGVKSILVETRYIDADWRSEHARFYSTTYRRYPSVAHRAHFFTEALPGDIGDLSSLIDSYKGYTILRPLPSQPVGRTMIEPPPELALGTRCEAIETVDVLGWRMSVRGMPFISQDAQYLRCAHADLWMVLRHAYLRHQLGQRLPSEIHDATVGGVVVARQVPSGGLSVQQMMAGMSTLGLSPALLPLPQSQQESESLGLLGLFGIICRYVNSNITPIVSSDNHVWLVVGYTRAASAAHPNVTLYRHDDAAGPYVRVDNPWQEPATAHQPWRQVMLPLPPKIYMTAERAETIGRWWFERWMQSVPTTNPMVGSKNHDALTFRTYGINSSDFKWALNGRVGFDSEVARAYRLTPFPRNLWVVEAVDRLRRRADAPSVWGEVIIDPTASHYATPQEPGIIAAHAPGFWWVTSPDDDSEDSGGCSEEPYDSGRPDFSRI